MNLTLNYLLQCVFIILPLFLAGVFFIFSLKKGLGKNLAGPIDFGFEFKGKRLFGANKTWRGFLIMPVAAFMFWLLIVIILKIFHINSGMFVLDYEFSGYAKILIFGLAYPFGELPNSFFKRRLGIEPGSQSDNKIFKIFFAIFDLIDSLLLCLLVLLFVYKINFSYSFGAFFIGTFIHYLTDSIMRKVKLKKQA